MCLRVAGVVVAECCDSLDYSHWEAVMGLSEWLALGGG